VTADPSPARERTDAIVALLGHPRLWVLCAVLGFLTHLRSLGIGLLADDVGHRGFILAQLEGDSTRPWWDMFVLIGGTPEELEKLRFLGRVPWWTSTQVQVSFFRPLTAASHYLDYWLWPDSPWAMHLHQLCWHGAACALAWLFFRRVCRTKSAGGAAGIAFALTHLHLSAVGWLAHRNAVLVLVFGLLCLLAHDAWRRSKWRPGAVLGPLGLLAALLCGELGVGVLGVLAAYALTLDPAALAKRAASLLPYFAVLICWRLAYDAMGYGALNSGAYLDPLREPQAWLSAAPGRVLELCVYLFGLPGTTIVSLPWRAVSAAVIVAVIVGLCWSKGRRELSFVALGVVMSLILLTPSVANERLLVLASLLSCLAVGEAVVHGLERGGAPAWSSVALLVGVFGLLSPIDAWRFGAATVEFSTSKASFPAASTLDDAQLRRQSVVVLHAPNMLVANLLPASREARGLQRPNFMWLLHAEDGPLTVRRLDARTLELYDAEGWLRGADTSLLRGPGDPFGVGDVVQTLDFRVEVVELDRSGKRPVRIEVRYRVPVGDPSMVTLIWGTDDFVRWSERG